VFARWFVSLYENIIYLKEKEIVGTMKKKEGKLKCAVKLGGGVVLLM
jgi:hypothetical protein